MKHLTAILIAGSILFSIPALAIDQTLLLKLLELKRESYLNRRGELSIDITPVYSQDKSLVPWTITKNYNYNLNTNFRLGLSDRLEFSLLIPFTSMQKEQYVSAWETYRGAGMGDPRFNFQYEMLSEKMNRPATYLTGGLRLPLGKSYFDGLPANELAPGSGYYATTWGLSFLKSIDPTALFWGFDYQWTFPREDYNPADIMGYNIGLAWALNQSVSLSLGLSGAVVGEDKQIVNGLEQTLNPAYNITGLSIGSNVMVSSGLFLNPSVFFGLTDEESDLIFSMGMSLKR